jgi:DNA-binding transcriptional regulator PaaX
LSQQNPKKDVAVVGDGTWLSMGEVVQLYRDAGFPESETTIRIEIDRAITVGEVESYRTTGRFRRMKASDVKACLAVKRLPPGEERTKKLQQLRGGTEGEGTP